MYVKEMRPKNWLKNIFVFLPVVFALELRNTEKLIASAIAFAAFCLVSSAVYIFNDICDMDKDSANQMKRMRPIAGGDIKIRNAILFLLFLSAIGLAVGFFADWLTCILLVIYLIVNALYTTSLKHKPVIDCFCIAAGFVLRVYAGGAASGEPVSDWLFLTVVAMSLFMAFGKRQGEMLEDSSAREVLQWYDIGFLKGMVFIFAGLAAVFYSLWAMERGCNMIYTVPIIIFIMSKYLLVIQGGKSQGDPTTVMFENKSLLAACFIYGLITVALLYFGG